MRKRGLFKKGLIWLLRFRHRKGYGVHSPFAFDLITDVFYGETPYYDFSSLKELVSKVRSGSFALWNRYMERRQICEMLFKLVNDAQSYTILEIGTMAGASTVYLSASRKSARCITLDQKSPANELASRLLGGYKGNIDYRIGEFSSLLPKALSELETLDFLLLNPGDCSLSELQDMFEQCCAKSNQRSVFVIRDIHSSLAMRRWWKELVADERLGITFDLYDLGIIYFDKKKIKQHYIVNF